MTPTVSHDESMSRSSGPKAGALATDESACWGWNDDLHGQRWSRRAYELPVLAHECSGCLKEMYGVARRAGEAGRKEWNVGMCTLSLGSAP